MRVTQTHSACVQVLKRTGIACSFCNSFSLFRTVVFVTSRSFLRKLLLDSVVKVCREAVVKQIARIVSFSIRQGPAAFRCHSTSVAKS